MHSVSLHYQTFACIRAHSCTFIPICICLHSSSTTYQCIPVAFMERCILLHVHFQCIRVTCCILLQCNAFHKVAFCCIQGLKHIRLHSDAFITRCILVVVHSCAFRMILHAAQGLHLVLVRYKYIRVHSCAFIYIHMHLIIYNIRIHMNVTECMLNTLQCIRIRSNSTN